MAFMLMAFTSVQVQSAWIHVPQDQQPPLQEQQPSQNTGDVLTFTYISTGESYQLNKQ